jgi:DNA-binding NarL/FixJ family response regulator
VSGLYEILRADGTRALIEYQTAWRFGAGQHLVAAREIPRHTAVEGPQDVTALQAGRRLTPREQEVLQLAADGSSTVEIAVALVLSPGTVKIHFQHIYEKLGVSGRAWAVAEGLRRGVIR